MSYFAIAPLLCWQPVELSLSVDEIISRPGVRVNCDVCGEEIINQREVIQHGLTLCRACAEGGYYHVEQSNTIHYLKSDCY